MLTVDTGQASPSARCPVALGQPGLIPADARRRAAYERGADRRELTPRRARAESASRRASRRADAAAPSSASRPGQQAHTVGLTEERAAQIVSQSGNARNVAFLAVLVLVLFIPIYWFYDIGVPALGVEGRHRARAADEQYVTDVSRGYALFLANCATLPRRQRPGRRRAAAQQPGQALQRRHRRTASPGTGHLNPNYITTVLEVGGRYVCGDAEQRHAGLARNPTGPLNYREVEELIAFITATNETTLDLRAAPRGRLTAGPTRRPGRRPTAGATRTSRRAPGATPVPACWRNPSGTIGGASGNGATASPAAVRRPARPTARASSS